MLPDQNASQGHQYTQEIGWGDDPSDSFRELRFRLQKDAKARVVVLDEKVVKAMVHYSKYYYYCIGDGCPACVGKLPSPRYLAWIFVYQVNGQGEPILNNGVPSGAIKAWMFGRDKYGTIAGLKKEYGDLRQLDLKVTCTEESFQRMDILPAAKCFWLNAGADFAKSVIEELRAKKVDPVQLMARTATIEQIRGFLNQQAAPDIAGPSTTPNNTDVVGVTNLDQSIRTSTQDLQGLLAKLNSATGS